MAIIKDNAYFTFCEENDFEWFGEEWNLSEDECAEEFKARIPLKITNISKNMDDMMISQRNVDPTNRIKSSNIDNWTFVFADYKQSKLLRIPKTNSTSSTITSFRKPLKEEIRSLLRAWASVKKNGGIFNFENEMIEGSQNLQYKCIQIQNENGVQDNFITVKQIPELE